MAVHIMTSNIEHKNTLIEIHSFIYIIMVLTIFTAIMYQNPLPLNETIVVVFPFAEFMDIMISQSASTLHELTKSLSLWNILYVFPFRSMTLILTRGTFVSRWQTSQWHISHVSLVHV